MKLSFRDRVLLLLVGLVLIVQLVNLSVILSTLSSELRQEANSSLMKGFSRLEHLLEERSGLLSINAEGLVAKESFRDAVVSGDAMAILSALRNGMAGIDADLAVLVTNEGELVGDSQNLEADNSIYKTLAETAEREGKGAAVWVVDGYARALVSVQVKAPLSIAWLILGSSLDDAMAVSLSEQLGMSVSFLAGDSSVILYGSTFDQARRLGLPVTGKSFPQLNEPVVMTFNGEEFLTGTMPMSKGESAVSMMLSSSMQAAQARFRSMRNRLLFYMALSVAIALGLAYWFASGVTRAMQLLSNVALRIRAGDYDTKLGKILESRRSDEIGGLIQIFSGMQDEIIKREATITYQAYHDELTGLPNRRRAQDQLLGVMEISRIKKRNNAAVLLGMDRYKQIVDTLGHKVGDGMMRALGERLPGLCRDAKLVARVSPDEFLVLVGCDSVEGVNLLAQEWMEKLELPVTLTDAVLLPKLSAGIVFIPSQANTADGAMRCASIALSDARERQLPICDYEPGRDESHIRKLSIIADLQRAVDQNELTIHYQPKLTMQTGHVASVEALVRWIHPEHGFMAPDEFIGLAESSGNIGLLTGWVLDVVIAQLSCWHKNGIFIKAAVNLSALDLQDEHLLGRIKALLSTYGVQPEQLILEVTESAMMKDTDRALKTLATMREFGLTISIDDFGTGYSSLSKLKDLPIDELKIDRAFVVNIESGSTKLMIMEAIIGLAHGMGLRVVSEGVETQAEWDVLTQLGNDVVQGYLVSRPLAIDDFNQWWDERFGSDHSAAA